MKKLAVIRWLVWLTLPLGMMGCGKSDPEPPSLADESPTPTPKSAGEGKDFSARDLRHKADQAANSVENFLKDQDPKLRDKFQRLADKVSDKLGQDKNRWREKLEEKRRELQPQIDQLRGKLGEARSDKNKEKLRDALSKLQGKSADTDKKLAELEAAGADVWKQFKARLKEDEAKDHNTPPTDEEASPTPTPRAR